jgi:hypothetical protein
MSRPFIQAGLYESEDDFLADLVRDLAQRKIKSYQNRVQKIREKVPKLGEVHLKKSKAGPLLSKKTSGWSGKAPGIC